MQSVVSYEKTPHTCTPQQTLPASPLSVCTWLSVAPNGPPSYRRSVHGPPQNYTFVFLYVSSLLPSCDYCGMSTGFSRAKCQVFSNQVTAFRPRWLTVCYWLADSANLQMANVCANKSFSRKKVSPHAFVSCHIALRISLRSSSAFFFLLELLTFTDILLIN